MNVKSWLDEKAIDRIVRACGSRAVKDASNTLRAVAYWSKERFVCEIYDDVAFFGGAMMKEHFRLYEMAVDKAEQGKGYGKGMIARIRMLCAQKGVKRITLRTNKDEGAVRFYEKLGGRIVGEKGNDYEIEVLV